MMIRRASLAVAVAAAAGLAVGACARQTGAGAVTTSTGDVELDPTTGTISRPTGSGWTARLTTNGGAADGVVVGMASVIPGSFGDQTRIQLNLSNAQANSVLPWQVRFGSCGSDSGTVVGPASAYPSVISGLDGRASLTAVLPFAITPGTEYSIVVFRSPNDMATPIACGNLNTGASVTR